MKRFCLIGIGVWIIWGFVGCASRSIGLSQSVRKQVAHLEHVHRENLRTQPQLKAEAKRLWGEAPFTHPETLYARHYDSLPSYLGGEVGFDTYCMGYAALARTRQADRNLRPERDTLYELLYTINDLLKNVSGNGTLFVHAAYRIPAYAEYYHYRSRKAAQNTVPDTEIQQTLSSLRKLIKAYRCEEGEEPLLPAQQTDLNERLARVESLLHSPESVRALQAYMRFLMDMETGTEI